MFLMDEQTKPRAKLSDLIGPLEMDHPDYRTYFDTKTMQIVSVERSLLNAAEEGDDEYLESVPKWQKHEAVTAREIIEDGMARFIRPPDKREFHEYRVMEDFIETIQNARITNQLDRAIRGRGAFRYFKDTLARFAMLDDWYEYLLDRMKEFAIEWAEKNNVAYEDDLAPRIKAMREQRKRNER